MEYISGILENEALISGISLIIAIAVPILVMIFTLRSQNKKFKQENEVKERQFKETIQRNTEYYKESMRLQEENDRISYLPFVFLNRDAEVGKRKDKYIFPLEIINIGNGIAIDVSVKFECDKSTGLPFVYREHMCGCVMLYEYTGFLFTNTIPVGFKATFELLLVLYENGVEISQDNKLLSGEVRFTVKYKDIHYNEYEQDYMFQYTVGIGMGRVESYLPRLVKQTYRKHPNLD